MEEVEEFKYLGVWFDRKLRGNVYLRRWRIRQKMHWKGDVEVRSEWTGGS